MDNIIEDNIMEDNLDRISVLPKEVLCHILSFLRTKHVAGTSILSTKWKNLLPLITNLELKLVDTELLHPHPPSNTHRISFQNFVHNLLNFTLSDTPSIFSLTLICRKIDDGQLIANWINAALRLNIKRMDIRISKLQNQKFFLDSLYGSTLVTLTLAVCFSRDDTEFRFSLPNLKRLSLHYMDRLTPVNALLASCPVLNSLLLVNCHCFQPGERLRIHSPSLVYLKVLNVSLSVNCVVELDAPQLMYMGHCGSVLINNMMRRNDLWIACLDYPYNTTRVSYFYDEKAPWLMQSCSGAEEVWMSENYIRTMHREPHHLPRFQNLRSLTVMTVNADWWEEMLKDLLESAPNLKKLILIKYA